jgi:hypothetical protein
MAGTSRVESPLEDLSRTASPAHRKGVAGVAKVSVAPMMEWTNRHCHYFLRPFSRAHAPALRADVVANLRYTLARGDGRPIPVVLSGASTSW